MRAIGASFRGVVGWIKDAFANEALSWERVPPKGAGVGRYPVEHLSTLGAKRPWLSPGRAGTASAVTERRSRCGPLSAPVRATSAPLLMGEARALSEFPAATAPHPSRPYGRATFSQEKALRFLMNYIPLYLLYPNEIQPTQEVFIWYILLGPDAGRPT